MQDRHLICPAYYFQRLPKKSFLLFSQLFSPYFLRRFPISLLEFSQKTFVIGNPVFIQKKCYIFICLQKICVEMLHADLIYISQEGLSCIFAKKATEMLWCNGQKPSSIGKGNSFPIMFPDKFHAQLHPFQVSQSAVSCFCIFLTPDSFCIKKIK